MAVEMTDAKYVAPTFTNEIRWTAFPQNLPSIVASHILNPQPGEMVLDMCAAPGECEPRLTYHCYFDLFRWKDNSHGNADEG